MKLLSWNCRGLNASDSLTNSYLSWLLSQFKPSFLFLQEIKTTVAHVNSLLRFTNPTSCYGMDANETRGYCSFLLGPLCSRCCRKG